MKEGKTVPRRRRPSAWAWRRRNAALFRLAGEVGRDAEPGNTTTADRQRLEHAVVALEGRHVAVGRLVGVGDDLRRLALIGPSGAVNARFDRLFCCAGCTRRDPGLKIGRDSVNVG
jgi:hypothetical protein